MAINVDDYLQDIDPDNVCGDDLQYDPAFIELEQAIKGKPEQQMGDTVTEAEPPNWRDIKKQSEALLSRTIDLRVLMCYLRALIALDGFSGLQDGLTLIKTLVEQRWDNLHPQLDPDDDNDPTERINILLSLCDHDTVLKPLQQTPLVQSKALGRFNFRHISIASGKSTATSHEKEISQATIDGSVQDSELESLQQTFQAITASLDNLNQLENTITDYVGISDAPSFAELRTFLKDSKTFLISALETKGAGNDSAQHEEPDADDNTPPANATTASAKSMSGVINNNQDVIKTLNMVCDYYRKHEPSSPVPMFVERAIRLVGKNFMDAIKDIAPGGMDEAKLILGMQNQDEDDD
ncbi:MAG: type VI secretion system protein TssA [Methylococcales bacterium]|nr:type VI secretion system protein TssA [Methylococcales bacterium]